MKRLDLTMIGINQEIRNRIRLSVAAYAYEIDNNEIMSDSEFDKLAYSINVKEKTGNRKLDNFFRKHFKPDTGMWIHSHPEKNKIQALYEKYYK
jgi:hypothetical protein